MSIPATETPGRVRALTETTFGAAIESHEVVVVDFWAPWCAPCRRFAPVFVGVAAEHPDTLFATVDIDAEPGLAAAAQVRALPTLMLFRDGLLTQTHQGGLRASRLTRALHAVRTLGAHPAAARTRTAKHGRITTSRPLP